MLGQSVQAPCACAEVGTRGEGGHGVVTVCGPGLQAGPAGSANAGCAGDALGGFSACRGRRLISTTEVRVKTVGGKRVLPSEEPWEKASGNRIELRAST